MTLGPLSNLFWMLPLGALDRVQIVRVEASALGTAIAPLFAAADDCCVPPSWAAVQQALATGGDASPADCLLVDLEAAGSASSAAPPAVWTAVYARLRSPQGVVVTRLASAGRLGWLSRRRAVERRLARSGFCEVRSYYVTPSAEQPLDLVPADATAVLVWDDQVSRPPWRRLLRRMLVRAGLHDLLFREVLVVAAT
jgi:hypothetical protein